MAAEGGAVCTVEIPWVQATYDKRPNVEEPGDD